MEKIIKKLLIIGCGRLGQLTGKVLSNLPIEVIGIKRKLLGNDSSFKLISLDIFSEKFSKEILSINPNFVIYCISSDSQTQESYQKNYIDGLRITIDSLSQLDNFQHLFFISSTRVYGQISENFLSESTCPFPSDYRGDALLKAEESLKKLSFNSTILRSSGIYGPNRNHILEMASDFLKWPKEDRWTNRIHERDIANFLFFLFTRLLNNKKIENLYLLTDSCPVPLYKVLKWIRSELGLSLKNIPISKNIKGKKLESKILPKLKFSLKYPDYKSGYGEMISALKKIESNHID